MRRAEGAGPWNHNTAYHSELLAAVPHPHARVLDVGCGDGLLAARMSTVAGRVVGVDPDASAVARARARVSELPDVDIVLGDLLTAHELDGERFDLVTCVATLHHLPLKDALRRMRSLMAPGGRLHVVGLAASTTPLDHLVAASLVLPVRGLSRWHGESDDPDMTTARPAESLRRIRRAAHDVLPGSRVRRRLYYRYSLTWTRPTDG